MSRTRRARGAAAVEFALVLPLLVLLVLGVIEWGWYFFTRQVVVNASREGARVGTMQYAAGTDVGAIATAAARAYITNAGVDPAKITTLAATNAAGTCPAGSSCLRIVYSYRTLTGFLDPIIGSQLRVVAYSQMRSQ